MKLLCSNQGKSLDIFLEVFKRLDCTLPISSIHYIQSDRGYYNKYQADQNIFKKSGFTYEWEVFDKSLKLEKLGDSYDFDWEAFLQYPSLYPAYLADRRLSQGPNCKIHQDYRLPITGEQLECYLRNVCSVYKQLFDEYKPDYVISFSPSTTVGFLLYLFCRKYQIPNYIFKATKIRGNCTFTEDFFERYPHFYRLYNESKGDIQYFQPAIQKSGVDFINGYINSDGYGSYEGAISIQSIEEKLDIQNIIQFLINVVPDLARIVLSYWRGRDNNYIPQLKQSYYNLIGRLRTRKKVLSYLKRKKRIINLNELKGTKFVFFPMNSEPEISLGIYSRYYLNQIETIRNIAHSLPLGVPLIIKEHPRSWGWRKIGYYKKIIEIPNVFFVPTKTTAREVLNLASATCVLSSFVGFESLLMGVPTIIFGHCFFDQVKLDRLFKITNLWDLADTINKALNQPSGLTDKEREHLTSFVCAVLSESTDLNLYGELLGKAGRVTGEKKGYDEQVEAITELLRKKISSFKELGCTYYMK